MKRIEYNEVKKYIEQVGYKLLSTEYKNHGSMLIIQCPEGHIYNTKYNNFYTGKRCSVCAGNKKKTLEQVKEYIESFGYKLLSTEYVNSKIKLETQCLENHYYNISYGHFKRGDRCPKCYDKMRGSNQKLKYSDINDYAENVGYKCLSTKCKNVKENLRFECTKGHKFLMTFDNFKNQKQRCPLCKNIDGGSKSEKEIFKYIKQKYSGKIVENDRTQIKNYWTGKNLELDILIPELFKAIEYNGTPATSDVFEIINI